MDIEQALSQAELYIRQNQTSQARIILSEILRDNPLNEEAWILSAQVSDKPEQVIYCLRQAVKINPVSSRARFLLDRLILQKSPQPTQVSPTPESQPLPDTQPHQAIHPTVATPEEGTRVSPASWYAESDDNFSADQTGVPLMAAGSATRSAAAPARPNRWLLRVLTIAASLCLLAPWIFDGNTSRTLSGAQILLGAIFSPLGVNVGIAGLAFLASLILPLMMFFRFQSGATQKWAERATIALAPLAAVLSLELISFFYAGLTSKVELRWGIWAACAFYLLAGLAALVNARRLENVRRAELAAAWPGRIFTWLISLGDLLAILVTVIGLVLGKYGFIEIGIGLAFPCIWLLLGALMSHIA